MIELNQWLEAGYKRFEQVKHWYQYASFGLQKLISDGKGKKYYITVFVYDNRDLKQRQPDCYLNDYSYQPEVQFCGDLLTHNLSLAVHENATIEHVEQAVEDLWLMLGKPYYGQWPD